jgi:hypothetical protein
MLRATLLAALLVLLASILLDDGSTTCGRVADAPSQGWTVAHGWTVHTAHVGWHLCVGVLSPVECAPLIILWPMLWLLRPFCEAATTACGRDRAAGRPSWWLALCWARASSSGLTQQRRCANKDPWQNENKTKCKQTLCRASEFVRFGGRMSMTLMVMPWSCFGL